MPSDFLRNSIPPETWQQWEQAAQGSGQSMDQYINSNFNSRGRWSSVPGGGGNVAGIPGLNYNRFRQGIIAGALGSVGAGAAGAAGGGAGSAGLSGTVGGTTMGAGGFPWAAALQGGSQLLSGYLNKRSSDKASNQQKKNTQAALGELTPEAIQRLMQMFYTQNWAQMMPQMQGAQQGIGAAAARSGMTGAGVTQQLRAGIPGQFANAALGRASEQALSTAGSRAGIQAGQPVNAPYSFGNDLQGLMQMMGRYGLLRNSGTAGSGSTTQTTSPWWIEGPGHGTVST